MFKMNFIKTIAISSLLFLNSCYLFTESPQAVVDGQRAVYQSLIFAQENNEKLLDKYAEDNKAAVVYHLNFIYEPKLLEVKVDLTMTEADKVAKLILLEKERDQKLIETFRLIDQNVEEMRGKALANIEIGKRLAESVYNYLSTSPIEVDNIEFWINQLEQTSGNQND